MNTRKVEIKDDLKLNVFDSGLEKDYPPNKTIVFIHGGAGCLLNWKHQLPYFSKKYRTIAYDWRGCGKSDNAESYTFDDHYTDFLAILQTLKVPPGPALVAHSYGCLIARRFINQHHVDKFVNVGMYLSGERRELVENVFSFTKDFFKRHL